MTIQRVLEGLSRPFRGLRGMVMSRDGLVCTAHPLASRTGARILEQGGNFLDAALATSAVLNVVEPYNSHLGGDAFMLIYTQSDGRVRAVNASGPAPTSASTQDFPGGVPVRGIRSVEVPGQVGGWRLIHEKFCTMEIPRLLGPAVAYARDGFPCNSRLYESVRSAGEALGSSQAWSHVFLPDGTPPTPGEIFRQKDLAETLQKLCELGLEEFYNGDIARTIAAFSESHGGLLRMQDLERYEAELLEPIRTDYRGFEVYEQPPVSQGHILLEELNIVEGYDLASLEPASAEAVHLLVEAMKLSFSDRYAYSGDRSVVDMPLSTMLSKDHARSRRELIDRQRARSSYPPGSLTGGDTTYFAVADAEGNAVSFIQSLFHGFGSGVVVPGTGILLNNRMTGFSLDCSSPNVLRGGKRTMHTLNTYMVFHDGRPLFIGGTPGGDKQVQTNLQVITKLLDWGMNAQEAAEHPRWAGSGGLGLAIEARFPKSTIHGLGQLGHEVQVIAPWAGGGAVQLIMIHPNSGALVGGSDPRCDGCAIGL